MVRQRLLGAMANNSARQKVIRVEARDKWRWKEYSIRKWSWLHISKPHNIKPRALEL